MYIIIPNMASENSSEVPTPIDIRSAKFESKGHLATERRVQLNKYLIHLVKEKPCLFDRNHEHYKDNKGIKAICWRELHSQMVAVGFTELSEPNNCKTRWETIRDSYTRARQQYQQIGGFGKGKVKSKYPTLRYYDAMLWYAPYCRQNPASFEVVEESPVVEDVTVQSTHHIQQTTKEAIEQIVAAQNIPMENFQIITADSIEQLQLQDSSATNGVKPAKTPKQEHITPVDYNKLPHNLPGNSSSSRKRIIDASPVRDLDLFDRFGTVVADELRSMHPQYVKKCKFEIHKLIFKFNELSEKLTESPQTPVKPSSP